MSSAPATDCFFCSTMISDRRRLPDRGALAMDATLALQFGQLDSRSIHCVAHSRWKWWPQGCSVQASAGHLGSSVMQIVQWKGSAGSSSVK